MLGALTKDAGIPGAQVGKINVFDFSTYVAVERGDLFFWNSHVAMALDEKNLIHATAFHMAVVVEDIQEVIGRIADMGEGLVLARCRP